MFSTTFPGNAKPNSFYFSAPVPATATSAVATVNWASTAAARTPNFGMEVNISRTAIPMPVNDSVKLTSPAATIAPGRTYSLCFWGRLPDDAAAAVTVSINMRHNGRNNYLASTDVTLTPGPHRRFCLDDITVAASVSVVFEWFLGGTVAVIHMDDPSLEYVAN